MQIRSQKFYSGILLISSLLLLNGCDDAVVGSGRLIKEPRDVKSFDAIEVSGAFRLYLSQGHEESLDIEADDNIIRYVQTRVSGGKLYLDTQGLGLGRATLRAYVTVVDLDEISTSGAVKISGETPLEISRLKIRGSGASQIDLEVYGDHFELNLDGASKSTLSGEVEKLSIRLSGASKMNAKTLYSKFADVNISGAGSATINVDDELYAKISGAGKVSYLGDPKVRSNISGAGKVSRLRN